MVDHLTSGPAFWPDSEDDLRVATASIQVNALAAGGITMRSIRLFLLVALAVGLAAGPASASASFPTTIALPDGFQPEGIAAGRGTTVYVGSLANGAIWRGDVRTGKGSILVPGTGGVAVGTEYEVGADRLWVAGGETGEVRVYDGSSGALLETYTFAAGFLNDLVVTHEAVYATDSFIQQLAVVPLRAGAPLPAPSEATTLPLSGDLAYVPGEFNVNGIAAARGWLILVQSNTGQLFRVDPATGSAISIDLAGGDAASGDGLELRGSTLYVVQNFLNQVSVFRLGPRLASAKLRGTLTSPAFDIPTTAAFLAGRLWVSNARFTTPPTPATEYSIAQLKPRP